MRPGEGESVADLENRAVSAWGLSGKRLCVHIVGKNKDGNGLGGRRI